MDDKLIFSVNKLFDRCSLRISEFVIENESKEYNACRLKVNGLNIVYRQAKVTPKKLGQFVTAWKRNQEGITEPLHEDDDIDFYVIVVETRNQLGKFVFPKSALIKNRILSSHEKDGKRGFRVYPTWDNPKSKQAIHSQKWQTKYFVEINESFELASISKLYFLI